MKIALLNGSPRAGSVSGFVLETLKSKLIGKAEFVDFNLFRNPLSKKDVDEISTCDALLIAAPLYFDALPSHVVGALVFIEENLPENSKPLTVFAVSNGGFVESDNNIHSFRIISNWCRKCGFRWMYGLGIGSGERLLVKKSESAGRKMSLWGIIGIVAVRVFSYGAPVAEEKRKKSFLRATDSLAKDIYLSKAGENVFIRPFFPKTAFLNNLMTNASFFVKVKSNGLKIKDLFRKDS